MNKINVFPVPDGDTGTNLLFTLRPIIKIKDNISENFGQTLSLYQILPLIQQEEIQEQLLRNFIMG